MKEVDAPSVWDAMEEDAANTTRLVHMRRSLST